MLTMEEFRMFLPVRGILLSPPVRSRVAARRARRHGLLGVFLVWSLLAGSFQNRLPAEAAAGSGTAPKSAATAAFPPSDPNAVPTPAPTVTSPPDTDYVDQAL